MKINKTFFSLYQGPILIAIAATLWAVDGMLRRSLFSLSPLIIVFYEHLIGSIILLPIIWKQLFTVKIEKQTLINISIVALLSGLLGTLWFTTALVKVNFISFSVVFLLQKLQPLFATTTAVILLKEKVTKKYIMWAILAFVAAYFVTFKNGIVNLQTGQGTVIAALYALGAAAAWGSSTAVSKLVLQKHSTVLTTGLRFLITAFFAFIAVLIFTGQDQILAVTTPQLSRFLVISLSTGMIALYIYYKGLQQTQAKIATIVELIFPMLAIVIDMFVYKSVLSPIQLIAAVVLLFAIYKAAQLNRNDTSPAIV